MDLTIDEDRLRNYNGLRTGIFVRAKNKEGKYGTYDICHLDGKSLLAWLRSDNGKNNLAENVIGSIFGHGHIADN